MGKQSYAEYLEERRAGLLPKMPTHLDEREVQLWNQCVNLIRDHLSNDETRWPERYQEAGAVFRLMAKGLNVERDDADDDLAIALQRLGREGVNKVLTETLGTPNPLYVDEFGNG